MEQFEPNPIPLDHPLNTRPDPGFEYEEEEDD